MSDTRDLTAELMRACSDLARAHGLTSVRLSVRGPRCPRGAYVSWGDETPGSPGAMLAAEMRAECESMDQPL